MQFLQNCSFQKSAKADLEDTVKRKPGFIGGSCMFDTHFRCFRFDRGFGVFLLFVCWGGVCVCVCLFVFELK